MERETKMEKGTLQYRSHPIESRARLFVILISTQLVRHLKGVQHILRSCILSEFQ